MTQIVNKTITLELVGIDGNAFALMGAFKRQARKEGWEQTDIELVLDECMKGDYDHLLQTLIAHTESPDDDATEAENDAEWDAHWAKGG